MDFTALDHKKAFTLVELLIALTIGAMIMAMVLVFYNMSVRTYTLQTINIEQMQNLRYALQNMAREVRMAGSGFSITKMRPLKLYMFDKSSQQWLEHDSGEPYVVRPIYGYDGGEDGPDVLIVCRFDLEFAPPLGYLQSELTPGQIRLQLEGALMSGSHDGSIPPDLLSPDDLLLVVDSQGRALATQALSSRLSGSSVEIGIDHLPDSFPDELKSFPAGAEVYNIKSLIYNRYYLENENLMVAAFVPSIGMVSSVLASGIEDLQIMYYNDDEKAGELSAGQHGFSSPYPQYSVSSVRIALLSKSPYPFSGRPKLARPAIFNRRGQVEESDAFIRQTLSETVRIRPPR